MRSHLASCDLEARADNPLLGIFASMLDLAVHQMLTIEQG